MACKECEHCLLHKTLKNVALSNLSLTDKKCIESVFEKYEALSKADVVEVRKVVEILCKIKTNIIKNVSTMIENDFSEIVKDALGERRDT